MSREEKRGKKLNKGCALHTRQNRGPGMRRGRKIRNLYEARY